MTTEYTKQKLTKAEYQKKDYESELAAAHFAVCSRDTNGDGDCHICKSPGYPLALFRPRMLQAAVMSQSEQDNFIKEATPFLYDEPELGAVIKGFRGKDGKILITECNLIKENRCGGSRQPL